MHLAERGGYGTIGSDLARLNEKEVFFYAINPSKLVDSNLMINYRDRDTKLGETE